jgi:hypothetical protein
MSPALGSPTADSLNPAYAPISDEEDENGVAALGLEDQSQKPAAEKSAAEKPASK